MAASLLAACGFKGPLFLPKEGRNGAHAGNPQATLPADGPDNDVPPLPSSSPPAQ